MTDRIPSSPYSKEAVLKREDEEAARCHASSNSAAELKAIADEAKASGETADATPNRGAEYLRGYRDGYFEARRVAIKALDRGNDE